MGEDTSVGRLNLLDEKENVADRPRFWLWGEGVRADW